MLIFKICIIIIGILLVIWTFFMSNTVVTASENITFDEEPLKAYSEHVLGVAEERLCRLSNEKIMAVSEYSDSVLEQISKNHSEVVFLYSMLSEKEEELKRLNEQTSGDTKDSEVEVDIKSPHLEVENAPVSTNFVSEEDKTLYMEQRNQILSLFKEGKSIREISKQLDLGQGEVQLVVNIFTGGKQ